MIMQSSAAVLFYRFQSSDVRIGLNSIRFNNKAIQILMHNAVIFVKE